MVQTLILRRIVLSLFLCTLTSAAQSDPLDKGPQNGFRFFYESQSPQFSTDASGKIIGQLAEKLTFLSTAPPVPIRLVEESWTRALTTVLSEKNACLVPLARTQERDSRFLWIGPLQKLGFGLYALKERHLSADSLEAVARRNFTVGVVANEASDSIAKAVPGLRRDAVTASQLNFRKLLAGRIDLLISRDDTAQSMMNDDTRHRIEKILDLPQIDLAIGCNLNSDPEVIIALQNQLSQFLKQR